MTAASERPTQPTPCMWCDSFINGCYQHPLDPTKRVWRSDLGKYVPKHCGDPSSCGCPECH